MYQNKNYLQTFQYVKAESVILGKTLILKLVDLKKLLDILSSKASPKNK